MMVWSSAWRKIYVHTNKKIYFSYFSFNFSCLEQVFASYFMILKIFYMSLFGCFWFSVPTGFPEVIFPRYDPVNLNIIFKIARIPYVSCSLEIEDASHYLLLCHNFSNHHIDLMNMLNSVHHSLCLVKIRKMY